MKTEAQGHEDGFDSGRRFPREPDEVDGITSGNLGGRDYVRGFMRGVADGSKAKST